MYNVIWVSGVSPIYLIFLLQKIIYLVLAVLGLHCCADLPLVEASRGYSQFTGFSLQWLLLLTTGSRSQSSVLVAPGLSSWRLPGSRAQAE